MSTIPSQRQKPSHHKPDRPAKSKEELRALFAEQDRAREALRQRLGVLDVAVELVREGRDRD